MTTTERFNEDFRADELALIVDLARRGLSLAFVGVAGIGKSNLLNCLRLRHAVLTSPAGSLHLRVIVLDGNNWDGSPAGFWRLARQEAEQSLGVNTNVIPLAGDPADRNTLIVRNLVGNACRQPNQRLVFVLDDADRLLQTGPLDLLGQLRTLRDENRDMFSYLLFTKRLPHRLGQGLGLRTDSKFYELFSSRIYALRPYQQADARHMLNYLNSQSNRPLRGPALATILHLSGGHAMLLKHLHELWLSQPPGEDDVLAAVVRHPDIVDVCRRIHRSLHAHEQEVLRSLSRGQMLAPGDAPAVTLLQKRGLLTGARNECFSPVLERYLHDLTSSPTP